MNDLFSDAPTQKQDKSIAPKPVDVLADFILKYFSKARHHPSVMPLKPFEAAHWWIDLQEPKHNSEYDEPVYKGEKIISWNTPYIDRLIYNLRKFLPFTEPQQVWIVEHIKQGIPWRGDEGKFYAEIIKEHESMKKNREGYIGNARKVLSEMKS